MSSPAPPDPAPDRHTPRAPDLRVLQANERTLLAWIRTALGVMAFGFVVARLGLWLREMHPERAQEAGGSLPVGVALVALGAGMLALASRRFLRSHRAILAHEVHVPSPLPSVLVALVLAVGGVVLAVYLAARG